MKRYSLLNFPSSSDFTVELREMTYKVSAIFIMFCDLWYLPTACDLFCFKIIDSVQFSSVVQLCPTLCDPMNCSMPGLPVHHQLPEFTQTHVHWVADTIYSSHPLSSPSPPEVFNLSQHQGLFKWVSSSHHVAKYWFQLQHQSFQWTPRTNFL